MTKLATIYKGLSPKYVWKDGKIGGAVLFVGTKETSEAWVGFIIDIAYVCLFGKITGLLTSCQPSFNLVMYCLSMVQIFFMGRMAMDEYAIRFFQNDLFHRIFYLLCIIGICLMIMNVDLSKSGGTCSIDPGYYYGMMIGHLITRSCLTGVYLVMMCGDPGDDIFAQFGIRSLAWIVSSVMFGLSCFWSSSTAKAYVLFGVGVVEISWYFILVSITLLKRSGYIKTALMELRFPTNIMMAQKRAGVFLLIVLGSCINNLMRLPFNPQSPVLGEVYAANIMGVILVFAFAMQFFDKCQRHEGEQHAMRRGMVVGVSFSLAHLYIGFFMLLGSAGLAFLASALRFGDTAALAAGKAYFSWGCLGTSVLLVYMRTLHLGISHELENTRHIINFCAICSFALLHGLLLIPRISGSLSAFWHITSHTIFVCVWVMWDVGVDINKVLWKPVPSDDGVESGAPPQPQRIGYQSAASSSTPDQIPLLPLPPQQQRH